MSCFSGDEAAHAGVFLRTEVKLLKNGTTLASASRTTQKRLFMA
jgi:hypothetical protein